MMSVQSFNRLRMRSYFRAMLRALAHWQPLPMSAFVTLMQWTSRTCGSAAWEVCPQVLLLHFGSAESHARAVWPLVCLFNSGPNLRLTLLRWSCDCRHACRAYLEAEWAPGSCLHRTASCCFSLSGASARFAQIPDNVDLVILEAQ